MLVGATRILMLGCSLWAAVAHGQQTSNWSGDIEAVLVETSGNTEETSISAEADVTRSLANWRQNVLLQSRYTEQDGDRTAERYTVSSQLDYKVNPNDFLFLRGRYDNEDVSGYAFQASTAAGYGPRLVGAGA